jgi:hypothetical protein
MEGGGQVPECGYRGSHQWRVPMHSIWHTTGAREARTWEGGTPLDRMHIVVGNGLVLARAHRVMVVVGPVRALCVWGGGGREESIHPAVVVD